MSSRPKRATAASTRSLTSCSWRTSAKMNAASAPSPRNSDSSAFPSGSLRPETIKRAPSFAKAIAAARPIPVKAPVIKTTGVLMAYSPKICPACSLGVGGKTCGAFISWKCANDLDEREGRLPWRFRVRLCRLMRHTCQAWVSGMELRHLRYFVAVAETGSLTTAAEQRLHTAQPSLSRQIRDLETEVGVQLLTRSARGVELTAAGRAFLEHARLALAQAEAGTAAA